MNSRPIRQLAALSLSLVALNGAHAAAAEPAPRAPAVSMPAMVVPYSSYASPESARTLAANLALPQPDLGNITKQRAYYGKYNDDRLAEMRKTFAFDTVHTAMGGVTVDVVTPKAGILPRNKNRVLINVHGGAFMWGSGSGAIVEAAPIAATGRIKVVTVDYRLAPEHKYPAASEDVAAVYAALLKTYPAKNIGIYGCSAGGAITAQTVGWLRTHNLPRPGAVGTLCGTGLPMEGDSLFIDTPLNGGPALPPTMNAATALPMPYLAGISPDDPVAYPGVSPAALAQFPPTLLIAGGRDFTSSSSTTMHRRLAAAGVETESFIFDGMPHAFFVWPYLPESKEAYAVITRFFDHHLGTGARR